MSGPQRKALCFQRDLLLEIKKRGSGTTDATLADLKSTFASNEANWRGAAVRALATEGIIVAMRYEPCRRASRSGSPIVRWQAKSDDLLSVKLAQLDRRIASLDADPGGGPPKNDASPNVGTFRPTQKSVASQNLAAPAKPMQRLLPGLDCEQGKVEARP